MAFSDHIIDKLPFDSAYRSALQYDGKNAGRKIIKNKCTIHMEKSYKTPPIILLFPGTKKMTSGDISGRLHTIGLGASKFES